MADAMVGARDQMEVTVLAVTILNPKTQESWIKPTE